MLAVCWSNWNLESVWSSLPDHYQSCSWELCAQRSNWILPLFDFKTLSSFKPDHFQSLSMPVISARQGNSIKEANWNGEWLSVESVLLGNQAANHERACRMALVWRGASCWDMFKTPNGSQDSCLIVLRELRVGARLESCQCLISKHFQDSSLIILRACECLWAVRATGMPSKR